MAHDFLDGIPEQSGTTREALYTPGMNHLMLRATSASIMCQRLESLQSAWGVIAKHHLKPEAEQQKYTEQLTSIAQGLIQEIDAIQEKLPAALQAKEQKTLFYSHKMPAQQWEELFTSPWNALKNRLERYCTHPHEWQRTVTLMPEDIGKSAFARYSYAQAFEKELRILKQDLPHSQKDTSFIDVTRRPAGSGHSQGR